MFRRILASALGFARKALCARRGSISIEAAIASSALLIFAAGLGAALVTIGAYIQAIDIAGAAARAHAIGQHYQPPRGSVSVEEASGLMVAKASVPAPFGTMRAEARFVPEGASG
ncbi:hypothetical protein [Corynebacterium pseudopelargi]|uniref:TadE-like protein n=1 Tax=Corynebacterium pseudopelargi TaxID=2080757 RepID=A0A3G6IZQ8_9CORY|nr:hypothetical protein [Corynebacterium pseudopelargi]AZA10168.1 hypothetical protein CPPEL_10350 [Corynebacterium pseudopelargi]